LAASRRPSKQWLSDASVPTGLPDVAEERGEELGIPASKMKKQHRRRRRCFFGGCMPLWLDPILLTPSLS